MCTSGASNWRHVHAVYLPIDRHSNDYEEQENIVNFDQAQTQDVHDCTNIQVPLFWSFLLFRTARQMQTVPAQTCMRSRPAVLYTRVFVFSTSLQHKVQEILEWSWSLFGALLIQKELASQTSQWVCCVWQESIHSKAVCLSKWSTFMNMIWSSKQSRVNRSKQCLVEIGLPSVALFEACMRLGEDPGTVNSVWTNEHRACFRTSVRWC